jgi:hypothetical protein
MKNIHLLPTDKPSRLRYDEANTLWISCFSEFGNTIDNKQYIYITSDEEIKEGDWCIEYDDIDKKWLSPYKPNNESWDMVGKANYCRIRGAVKKIILTTDPQLIADGVQDVDDEFLEWFVKNPSCEEVNAYWYEGIEVGHFYKIIIPKEEPKQETLEEAAEKYVKSDLKKTPLYWLFHDTFKDGAKWQAQRMVSKVSYEEALSMQKTSNFGYESKINELEEQIKRMYSKKDIKDFLETLHFNGYIDHDVTKLNDLIEQNLK